MTLRIHDKFTLAKHCIANALKHLDDLGTTDKVVMPGFESLELEQIQNTLVKYYSWLDQQQQSHWIQEPDCTPYPDIHTDQEAP